LNFLAPGRRVRWRDRAGTYPREAGDGEHAESIIAKRVYRPLGLSGEAEALIFVQSAAVAFTG
jgi:hypothetical protein